jgi:hypothetical protein
MSQPVIARPVEGGPILSPLMHAQHNSLAKEADINM